MLKNDFERIDDLQYEGLKLIQDKRGFCFGLDAVLVANFAKVKKDEVVCDFGCGSGIIPILLSKKTKASKIYGVEIQKEYADLAKRNVELNSLNNKVFIINDDVRIIDKIIEKSSVDVITCNPPYKKAESGILNPNDGIAVARHEIKLTLYDVILSATRLIKQYGKLFLIHRPERLCDIICFMREQKIEPKTIRFVHPHCKKPPNMVLIEGCKNEKPFLKIEKPLFVFDENGKYSKEIDEIYKR